MENEVELKALFLDIGGVLLTNGWGRNSRKRAAELFEIDYLELDDRHLLLQDTYETGKMSLDEYLELAVFYRKRRFTVDDFKTFMMGESRPYCEMIKLVRTIKDRFGLKTVAINNEGKEINDYRIKQFGLASVIDVFASSCNVQLRKPDKDIFGFALKLAHLQPEEVLFIDDRLVHVEVARNLGMYGIHHQNIPKTCKALMKFGLNSVNHSTI